MKARRLHRVEPSRPDRGNREWKQMFMVVIEPIAESEKNLS